MGLSVTQPSGSANGASTLVLRDPSGAFSANVITSTGFSGNGASIDLMNSANVNTYNYPEISPSIMFDFVNSQYLSPRITFTRTSPATYFDAKGIIKNVANNVARFDHDPVTFAARGILFEDARTNFLTYSDQFDNAVWSKSSVSITANNAISPDASNSADTLLPSGVGSLVRNLSQTYTTTTQGLYTFSVFVKDSSLSNGLIALRIRDTAGSNDVRANFNISSLVVPTTAVLGGSWSGNTATVQQLSNGWSRISITANTTTVFTGLVSEIYLGGYQGTTETIGNALIWGAQLESGGWPSSYIPTVATTSNRSIEFAKINLPYDWLNQSQGTAYCEFTARLNVTQTPLTFTTIDGHGYRIRKSSINRYGAAFRDGVTKDTSVIPSPALVEGQVIKVALAIANNDCVVTGGGQSVAKTEELPILIAANTIVSVDIGYSSMDQNHTNGHIRRIAYYPSRNANTALQALTSPA